jgi:hypothetical protein
LIRRAAAYLWVLVVLFTAAGASCPIMRPQSAPSPPIAFPRPPTLPELVRTLNSNTERVYQLHTDSALLTIPGAPALRASLALQRPRNFRLRAHFVGVGQVLDAGSNDERFWALIDAPQLLTNMPRAVYTARHDQLRRSAARQVLPLEPQWLIEAFGLVLFDPTGVHEGPYRHGPEQLQIRSRIASPDGDLTRVVVVHESYGVILEQHLYDAQGQLLASALASNHRFYPAVGVSLPHRVEVRLPPPNPAVQIEVQTYTINQLYGDPAQLWTMPAFPGYQVIDLGDPSLPPASPGPASLPNGPAALPGGGQPATSFRPRYRGYPEGRRGDRRAFHAPCRTFLVQHRSPEPCHHA